MVHLFVCLFIDNRYIYEIEDLGLIYSYLYIIRYKKQSKIETKPTRIKLYFTILRNLIYFDENITRHRVIHNNETDGLRLL